MGLYAHIYSSKCAAGSHTQAAAAAREHFGTKLALFACCGAHKTQKTRSRALSAGQCYHMGLYAHICTSKCASGSPTSAAAAEREHSCTELALFAGCGGHKTQKTCSRTLSAGQSHHMGLYAHMCTSKCAAGPPRSLTTRLAPASAAARIKWLWEQGARSREHRHGAKTRLDASESPIPPPRSTDQAGCLGIPSTIASTAARIKWLWEQGARSRAHRHGAQPTLDVSGSRTPTNVPRVPSRPACALPTTSPAAFRPIAILYRLLD